MKVNIQSSISTSYGWGLVYLRTFNIILKRWLHTFWHAIPTLKHDMDSFVRLWLGYGLVKSGSWGHILEV